LLLVFYWNGANNNDKAAHGGNDLLPWWLNEVYWQDKIAGNARFDLFDVHAYPERPIHPDSPLPRSARWGRASIATIGIQNM